MFIKKYTVIGWMNVLLFLVVMPILSLAVLLMNQAFPIGMYSEEALESRNKDFRNLRQYNTEKFSKETT